MAVPICLNPTEGTKGKTRETSALYISSRIVCRKKNFTTFITMQEENNNFRTPALIFSPVLVFPTRVHLDPFLSEYNDEKKNYRCCLHRNSK
jgi:hypothetical protein